MDNGVVACGEFDDEVDVGGSGGPSPDTVTPIVPFFGKEGMAVRFDDGVKQAPPPCSAHCRPGRRGTAPPAEISYTGQSRISVASHFSSFAVAFV